MRYLSTSIYFAIETITQLQQIQLLFLPKIGFQYFGFFITPEFLKIIPNDILRY